MDSLRINNIINHIELKPWNIEGHKLNIRRDTTEEPKLSYPPDFWQGLGIVSTNVGGLSKVAPSTGK